METEREIQQAEFLAAHEAELLEVATNRNWNQKGFELKEWVTHLLPDGYSCPPEETYAELQNALDYLRQDD